MPDPGNEPSNTSRATGVELAFIFTLPALMIVGSIAEMAHTGYWWLMGVAFAGALIATGLVALTIFHYTNDAPEADGSDAVAPASSERQKRQRPPRRHHRLALHH